MNTMNIPENLSVDHSSDKGRAKRNAASKRYYQKKRKEKLEATLSDQIAEAEENLKNLKSKFSQL